MSKQKLGVARWVVLSEHSSFFVRGIENIQKFLGVPYGTMLLV
jgi:hypothetical protein